MIVVAIVIVGAAAAGIFLTTPRSTQTSTMSSSSGVSSSSSNAEGPFKITYDTLTVGYQGGLFQLGLENLGGKQVVGIVATLNIPTPNGTVQAVMCTGGGTSTMGFGNCLAAPHKSYTASPATGGSFPANATFTGIDSGVGPGSAVPGQSYPLIVVGNFLDGTSSNQTFTVQAVSG